MTRFLERIKEFLFGGTTFSTSIEIDGKAYQKIERNGKVVRDDMAALPKEEQDRIKKRFDSFDVRFKEMDAAMKRGSF